MAAAEAMTAPHGAPMAMAGHCDTVPGPDSDGADRSIDCAIACAMLAHAGGTALKMPIPGTPAPLSLARAGLSGLHPEADPPPPRRS